MKKSITAIVCLVLATTFCTAQNSGAIGRKYSPKLLEQDKYFNNLKKSNGESYGNKELSVEIAIGKMVEINIENNNRTIEIKTWDEPKIKITTMVFFDGAMSKLSSESWFDKLNIKTKLLGNSIRIKTDALNTGSYSSNGSQGSGNSSSETVEVYSVDGQYIKSEPAKRKVVTIYVPKDNKLNIDSKYADVVVSSYLKKLTADITNGSLELDNVNTINLRSKYSNISINEVQSGEIDFINGKLNIGVLGDVELDTKYSTIEIGNAKKLNFKSTNDDYEIEEINALEGTKQYGSMRIGKLIESIQIDGTNADVKIKKISSELKSIWFDNKYADLRLPLKEVKNFSVNYEGTYSTILTNFMKAMDKPNRDENVNIDLGNISNTESSKISTGDIGSSKFKATVGNGGAKITINCQNCTVDFK